MKEKFRNAVILMFVPFVINVLVTVMCAMTRGSSEFRGYLAGTLLSLMFSLIWVFMARKVSESNIMVLFTLSLGSFPIKILIFAIFAFGGLYIFEINQMYFGFSFLFGTIITLVIEVWFIISVNKLNIARRAGKADSGPRPAE